MPRAAVASLKACATSGRRDLPSAGSAALQGCPARTTIHAETAERRVSCPGDSASSASSALYVVVMPRAALASLKACATSGRRHLPSAGSAALQGCPARTTIHAETAERRVSCPGDSASSASSALYVVVMPRAALASLKACATSGRRHLPSAGSAALQGCPARTTIHAETAE